jgi:hypothetical protein
MLHPIEYVLFVLFLWVFFLTLNIVFVCSYLKLCQLFAWIMRIVWFWLIGVLDSLFFSYVCVREIFVVTFLHIVNCVNKSHYNIGLCRLFTEGLCFYIILYKVKWEIQNNKLLCNTCNKQIDVIPYLFSENSTRRAKNLKICKSQESIHRKLSNACPSCGYVHWHCLCYPNIFF